MNNSRLQERGVDRRSVLKYGAVGAGAVAAAGALASCSDDTGGGSGSEPEEIEPTTVEGVEQVVLTEEIADGPIYPEPYVGPRAWVREQFYTGDKTFKIGVKLSTDVVGDWNENAYSKW